MNSSFPIANCIVSVEIPTKAEEIVKVWSAHSGKPSSEMTVNFSRAETQSGNKYAVVANLYLPSIWQEQDVASLQTGLANAISECFSIGIDSVFVLTTVVSSGCVVESGKVVKW